MPDIDLKGCTSNFVLEHAVKSYGENWLNVLSKTSYLSRQYIVDKLNEHLANGTTLEDEFTESLQSAFLEEKAEFIQSVILSRFEIIQMTSNQVNNSIDFIKIFMDGVVIQLDFYDQNKIANKTDCIRTMQSTKSGIFKHSDYPTAKEECIFAEKWLSVLETLESEQLNLAKILQTQIKYLSQVTSYKTPMSFGTNVQRISQLYGKKNRKERYVKAIANIELQKEMIFSIDHAELLQAKLPWLEAKPRR